MERLTFEGNFCDIAQCTSTPGGSFCEDGACSQRKVWERLKAYEDTGLMPDEIRAMQEEHFSGLEMAKLHSALMELKKYQEADKDGRLVVLPCQSGEHVFALLDDQKRVRECEVKHAVLDGWRKVFFIEPVGNPGDAYGAPFGAFGQTVFLTREEAEKALEAKRDA